MAALIDSRLVWRASLPTSSAMLPRLPEAADSARTEPSMASRDCTKPSSVCSRPSRRVSQCASMLARAVMSPALAWVSDCSARWSSSDRIWLNPSSSWPVAACICCWARPTWAVQCRAASCRRWPMASSAGASRLRLGLPRRQRCHQPGCEAVAALPDGASGWVVVVRLGMVCRACASRADAIDIGPAGRRHEAHRPRGTANGDDCPCRPTGAVEQLPTGSVGRSPQPLACYAVRGASAGAAVHHHFCPCR